MTGKELIQTIISRYPTAKENEMLDHKCLTAKGKVYRDLWQRHYDYYGETARKQSIEIYVYCQDMGMPTELDKVLQWLDNSDMCDLYWVTPYCNCWDKHDVSLFMPEPLQEISKNGDYLGMHRNNFDNTYKVTIFGQVADMVYNKILSRPQATKLIEKEVIK